MKISHACCVLWALATLTATPTWSKNQSRDEAEIRGALAAETRAYLERDLDASVAFFAPDLVIFDIMPPLQKDVRMNRQTNIDLFASSKGPVIVDFYDIHVLVDHAHAYVRYFCHSRVSLIDGNLIDMTVRISDVWEKRQGRWTTIFEHASLPVNLLDGKAVFMADKDKPLNAVTGH